jgi:glycosyltransferase involved in cell wall biosynthesis
LNLSTSPSSLDRFRAEGASQPAGIVVECDIAESIPAIPPHAGVTRTSVLVRLFTEPVGLLSPTLPPRGVSPDELAQMIVDELGGALRQRVEDCGLTWTGELPTDGLRPPRTPRFLESRARILREGPEMTVAVCTRDRPDDLVILLDSLDQQEYKRLRILVVDNAPSDDRTRRLVSRLAQDRDLEYVAEHRPGLSWARNRAIEVSESVVIAWADDDEVCDRWWAAEVARGFVEVPEADAVTGMVVPSELETQCQAWFEQYSGVARGRGFSRAVFSPATAQAQSPLYPLPPYGTGANMAFRREALDQIGGFDCALGAGTATLAGEDTAALSSLLLAGGTIVYQPSAIVRHRHRRDYDSLRRVMLGYGRGLSAYYASMLAHQPSRAPALIRLSRQALRDQVSREGRRLADLEGFPPELLRLNRIGLLQGAFMYPGARLHARRLAGTAARA